VLKEDCATLCLPGKKWKVSVSPAEAEVVLGEKESAGPTVMSWFMDFERTVRGREKRKNETGVA